MCDPQVPAECSIDDELPSAVGQVPGRIIILNGTSCSGKSTIAIELVATLEPTYFHLGIDTFRTSGPQRQLSNDEGRLQAQRIAFGFHRAVAGFAAAGNNVVMDCLLGERWRVGDCLEVFAGFDVVLVGLHCPAAELRRREQARGTRALGRAESQLATIHAYVHYDVQLDTSTVSPSECAILIADHLADGETSRAFSTLS